LQGDHVAMDLGKPIIKSIGRQGTNGH
jgi:hypothetical protein